MQQYSSYLFLLDNEEIDDDALYVLYQLQCKANNIITNERANSSLLNTSMQVDTKFYFKFADTELGESYMRVNYQKWFKKALMMSEIMPQRGDLIMPFLSYAINNNKNKDAVKIWRIRKRPRPICDLITANQILARKNIVNQDVKKSINLIKQAIDKGIFNEIVYGFWINQDKEFKQWGVKCIPLSPDILFLISDKEKSELEEIIKDK